MATAAIGAGLVWFFGRRASEPVGANAWALGLLLVATYFALVVLRGQLPTFISITIANAVAVVALGAMHAGACQIRARQCPLLWHAAATVVVIIVIGVFFREAEAGYHGRIAIMGIVTAVQCVSIAITMWHRGPETSAEELSASRRTARVFIGVALLQIGRMIAHSPLVGAEDTSILSDTLISKATALVFLFWALSLPFLVAGVNEARAQHRLRTVIGELQQALSEVKTLRGLLPICASCRKIRETDNTWSSMERHLEAHTDAQMSHGMCPDCMRTLYPEYADEILNGAKKS